LLRGLFVTSFYLLSSSSTPVEVSLFSLFGESLLGPALNSLLGFYLGVGLVVSGLGLGYLGDGLVSALALLTRGALSTGLDVFYCAAR